MSKKNKKWIKKRHVVIQRIAKFFLYPFVKIKYGATIVKCKDKRQRLILGNHQTAFDQFFVAYGYHAPVYYLASEDIFSNGLVSKLLKFAVNPIPTKKQANDVRAVMNCIKVAKEGGTIAIFPEGNRTFSGTTEYISGAIVKLVRALKLPISFFVIKGGYGVQPRWSDKVRRGKITACTARTLEPEEYLAMTDEEIYDLIKKELYVDEREIPDEYKSKRLAEGLERAIYVCPYCKIAEFTSKKDRLKCKRCGREVIYSADKKLRGVGFDFPYQNVKEWYDYQTDYISGLDVEKYFDKSLFEDEAGLYLVELYKSKSVINKKAKITTFGDRFCFGGLTLPFNEVSALSVLGKNKLNVYYNDKVYQLKGDKSFNAVKYVNIFYRYQNYIKGETNVKFLGL